MTAALVARLDVDAAQELLEGRLGEALRAARVGVLLDRSLQPAWMAEDDPWRGFTLLRTADEFAQAIAEVEEQFGEASDAEDGVERFADVYPALDRWRKAVLAKKRYQRTPLEAAAAWEVQAIECERSGETTAAELAREAAVKVLRPRRRPA